MSKANDRESYVFHDGEYPPKRAMGVLIRAPLESLILGERISADCFSGDLTVRTQAIEKVLAPYARLWFVEGELGGAMVLDVINLCFSLQVPVPGWIQERFLELHTEFRTYSSRTLDDAFVVGTIDEREQEVFADRIRMVPSLVAQMRLLAKKDKGQSETTLISLAAGVLGISRSYARELYLEARHVWGVKPVVKTKQRKPTGSHSAKGSSSASEAASALGHAAAAWYGLGPNGNEVGSAASKKRKLPPR